jgi:hypothetical protein
MEAVFSVTYDRKCAWTEKVLKRSEKELTPKLTGAVF